MSPPKTRLDDISLAPDPVIEVYKKSVDRSVLRENLKLTPEQRLLKVQEFVRLEVLAEESKRR